MHTSVIWVVKLQQFWRSYKRLFDRKEFLEPAVNTYQLPSFFFSTTAVSQCEKKEGQFFSTEFCSVTPSVTERC